MRQWNSSSGSVSLMCRNTSLLASSIAGAKHTLSTLISTRSLDDDDACCQSRSSRAKESSEHAADGSNHTEKVPFFSLA